MKNILVSGASGIVGYGILKSIRMLTKDVNLIGTSIYDDSVASGFCDLFIKAPLTNSEGYVDWLEKIICDYKIDMLIPGIEIDMFTWGNHVERLKATGAVVLLNDLSLIISCKDKWSFYKNLEKKNCQFLIPTSLSNDFDELFGKFGLPLILKPRQGTGSKGIVKVLNKETFLIHKKDIGSKLLVQPLIGSDHEEYTTAAYCNGTGGFYALITLKRKLSKEGYTEKAEVIENDKIKEAVSEICNILKPLGPTNFQFRFYNGSCKLLEINPRISSSTSIRSSFGYNESVMAIEYYMKGKIPKQPTIRRGKAVRYVEDFIFYTDE